MDAATCPRCKAPRVPAANCPGCGLIYARADRHAAALRQKGNSQEPLLEWVAPEVPQVLELSAQSELPLPTGTTFAKPAPVNAGLEFALRLLAIPLALGGGLLLMSSQGGRFLGRTVLSMWLHEMGHAVSAWFCGFAALPGAWVTLHASERSVGMPVMLAFLLLFAMVYAYIEQRRILLAGLAVLLGLQFVGSLLLSAQSAHILITFAGDAGCFVFGTALMASFYAARHTSVYRNGLRWGFLVIGAVSFMDVFEQWWAARTDSDRIPFGGWEGVGSSDASKLFWNHGWSLARMVDTYVGLGIACLIVLAAIYGWGLLSAPRSRAS